MPWPGDKTPNAKAGFCVAYVWGEWRGGRQCERRRNPKTKDGEWCMQHCPDRIAAARKEKADQRLAFIKRKYRDEVEEARRPYMEAAAAAVLWAEAEFLTPTQIDTLRASITALAENAESEVYVPWELRPPEPEENE